MRVRLGWKGRLLSTPGGSSTGHIVHHWIGNRLHMTEPELPMLIDLQVIPRIWARPALALGVVTREPRNINFAHIDSTIRSWVPGCALVRAANDAELVFVWACNWVPALGEVCVVRVEWAEDATFPRVGGEPRIVDWFCKGWEAEWTLISLLLLPVRSALAPHYPGWPSFTNFCPGQRGIRNNQERESSYCLKKSKEGLFPSLWKAMPWQIFIGSITTFGHPSRGHTCCVFLV